MHKIFSVTLYIFSAQYFYLRIQIPWNSKKSYEQRKICTSISNRTIHIFEMCFCGFSSLIGLKLQLLQIRIYLLLTKLTTVQALHCKSQTLLLTKITTVQALHCKSQTLLLTKLFMTTEERQIILTNFR
jgi:hypothetical protein